MMTFRETRRSAPSVTHTPLSRDGWCSPVFFVATHAFLDLIVSSKSFLLGFVPCSCIRDDLIVSSLGRCGSGAVGNLLSCFILLSSSEFDLSSFQSLFGSIPFVLSGVDLVLVSVNDLLLSGALGLGISGSNFILHQLFLGLIDSGISGNACGLQLSELGEGKAVGLLGQVMGISGGVPCLRLGGLDSTESLNLSFGYVMGILGDLQVFFSFDGHGFGLDVDGEGLEVDLGFAVTLGSENLLSASEDGTRFLSLLESRSAV